MQTNEWIFSSRGEKRPFTFSATLFSTDFQLWARKLVLIILNTFFFCVFSLERFLRWSFFESIQLFFCWLSLDYFTLISFHTFVRTIRANDWPVNNHSNNNNVNIVKKNGGNKFKIHFINFQLMLTQRLFYERLNWHRFVYYIWQIMNKRQREIRDVKVADRNWMKTTKIPTKNNSNIKMLAEYILFIFVPSTAALSFSVLAFIDWVFM